MKSRVSEYSRTTTLLLAVFFGVWAVHRFFVGYKRRAVVQLIFTLVMETILGGFLYRHPFLFAQSFNEPVLVTTVLTDYRTLLGILLPLGLVMLFVLYDIVRLFLGQFQDSHGRPVKIWAMNHSRY